MTVSQIISLVRNQTWWTTTAQVSDDQMLIYLNIVYQELMSDVAETDKKLTWEQWIVDTVAWQSEYTLPILNTAESKPWLKRLVNVYTKYKDSDIFYTKVKAIDYESFQASSDYLKDYTDYKATSSGNWKINPFPYPFLVRADEFSFFMNPAPENSVTNWLKIQWIYTPLDLTIWWEETDIKLQREYHNILALWMEQYVWGYRQLDNKRNIAINRYMIAKANMLEQQYNMTEIALRDTLPNLDMYE